MKPLTRQCFSTLLTLAVCGGAVVPAMAGGVRSSAQTSVNSTYNPNYNPNVNANYNPNVNPNYNPNVFVNRNAPASPSPNVATRSGINADVEGGSQGGCCYQDAPSAPTVAGITIPALPYTFAVVPDLTSICVHKTVHFQHAV